MLIYWAAITDWIAKYGYLPIVLIGMFSFALGIWILNGVIWISRQKRPSKQRIAFDYSYSLTLTDIFPSLYLTDQDSTLELRPRFKNASNRAFMYKFERLEFRIEDRFARGEPKGAILAANTSLTVIPGFGFNRAAWDSFKDRTGGSVEFTIVYGHPEYGFSRRATKTVHLDLFTTKTDQVQAVNINWTIQKEDDEEIS